jgi:hypothetical protein
MRQLTLINIVLMLFAAGAHAAQISVGNINDIYVANQLIGSSSSTDCVTSQTQENCDFLTPGPTTYLNNTALATAVTSNPANYVLSPYRNSAYIDLGFDGYDIYNGAGNDLVIFIVGNATSFGLDVFDASGAKINSSIYDVPADGSSTVFDNDNNWLCVSGSDNLCTGGAALSAIFIDLGDSIAGDVALGSLRIFLGNDYNGSVDTGSTRPRFSLAGGFYTEATVVPLPLPAILFSSGLALLGWVGRRKPL